MKCCPVNTIRVHQTRVNYTEKISNKLQLGLHKVESDIMSHRSPELLPQNDQWLSNKKSYVKKVSYCKHVARQYKLCHKTFDRGRERGRPYNNFSPI